MRISSKNFAAPALWLAALVFNLFIPSSQAASWSTNGPLHIARYNHTATLLQNGRVLIAGGQTSTSGFTNSVELYDPTTGTNLIASPLNVARAGHTATLLMNGKVLVVGGTNASGFVAGAELYDPIAGTWTVTGSLATARNAHTATLLRNGQVLVAGGYGTNSWLTSSELYDPVTGNWTATVNPLNTARRFHTATLLTNGLVLVAGGDNGGGYLVSDELYDPVTQTWTATGDLITSREFHTATLLPNGQVLIAGGRNSSGTLSNMEVYVPATGINTATGSLTTRHSNHTATLLPNGTVLFTGSFGGSTNAEFYDPVAGTNTTTSGLNVGRYLHTATLLANGKVLVIGGQGSGSVVTHSTETYDYANGTWTLTGAMNAIRYYAPTMTLLSNGQVLAAGGATNIPGTDNEISFASAELFDPSTGTWKMTNSMSAPRSHHTATLLANGNVLVVGGYSILTNGLAFGTNSSELFNSFNGVWTMSGNLGHSRSRHTATLLPDGQVLVAGGNDNSNTLSSCELYDSVTGTWTPTGSMNLARSFHTATLLPNGKVLVAGGSALPSAELYNPASGTWTTTSPIITAQSGPTATLLPNGKVLVVGTGVTNVESYDVASGTWSANSPVSPGAKAVLLPNGKVLVCGGTASAPFFHQIPDAELYDPALGTWTVTGSMNYGRYSFAAILLFNGNVLVEGGTNNTSAEIYDPGLGYTNLAQPQITFTTPLNLGGSLVVTGAQFRGVAQGSGGNAQDSATGYPLVQLRSLESGQTVFLPGTSWSTNSFVSAPVVGFPPGYALVTAFVNGIQSTSSIVNVGVSVPALGGTMTLTNGSFKFGFTYYAGAPFSVWASTNLSLPTASWTSLGSAVEISPGQFSFTDAQAKNNPQRFYQVRSP